MKKIIYLLAFVSFFSCRENSIFSEGSTSAADTPKVEDSRKNSLQPVQELKGVDDIRMEHSYIASKMTNSRLVSSSFNYNCNEEKKGKVTYYYENGQPRLIRHTYNEYSHFSAIDEYFIKDGSVFFVFSNHVSWNFSEHNQTRDNITERRFYILENNPVKCLEKKYSVNSNDENPPESNEIPNEETECSSMESVLMDFEMLFELREQENDRDCLEES